MDKILVSLFVITLAGYMICALWRPPVAAGGLSTTAEMLMQALPWIVVSMFLAGLLAQFLKSEWIARLLGREAGFMAIVIGALMGLLGTGSRWAMYPIAAGLIAAEANPGAVFSFVTSWQLVSVTRIPAEIPFYGETFAFVRAILSFGLAVLGGVIVDRIMR